MKAAVIMGSASDEAKVEKGIAILKEYGVDVEVRESRHAPISLTVGWLANTTKSLNLAS